MGPPGPQAQPPPWGAKEEATMWPHLEAGLPTPSLPKVRFAVTHLKARSRGRDPRPQWLLMLPALLELASGTPAQGRVGQKAEPVRVLGSGRRPGGSFPGVSPLSSPSAPSQARPLHSLHGDGRNVLALLCSLWGLEELLCLWALVVLL